MLKNIEYVYGTNNDKKVLLGAKVFLFDGEKLIVEEVYVGLPFELDDILESTINASTLGVTNLDAFAAQYNELNAAGVVYFPQVERYYFLEEGDKVLLWNGNDRIEDTLENALDEYRERAVDKALEEKLKAKRQEYLNLDPANPLVELYGLPLSRQKPEVSSR